MAGEKKAAMFRLRGRAVEIFGRSMTLPASRISRIAIGILFVIGGLFSILPVLGLWMLPLGLLILSMDIGFVRRWRRRADVRWTRWRSARRAARTAAELAARRPER